jgi:hypothetical protein
MITLQHHHSPKRGWQRDVHHSPKHWILWPYPGLSFWGEWSLSSTITRLNVVDRELFITHITTGYCFTWLILLLRFVFGSRCFQSGYFPLTENVLEEKIWLNQIWFGYNFCQDDTKVSSIPAINERLQQWLRYGRGEREHTSARFSQCSHLSFLFGKDLLFFKAKKKMRRK